MANTDLLSNLNRVESPFVIVTIGGITFGAYNKENVRVIDANGSYSAIKVEYPNFIQSLTVTKINGTVNSYVLNLTYAITYGDDPNLLEKIFSRASKDRKITLTYGDYYIPSYIYKEEEAIITGIKSNVDVSSSTITYTINCTSQALKTSAGSFTFPRRYAKPSDVIKEILYDNTYGLLEIFYGMHDKELVLSRGLIASDDKPVLLQAQQLISVFDYLKYLVSCMSSVNDKTDTLQKTAYYALSIIDEVSLDWNGPYFKVQKVPVNIPTTNSIDAYEIDVGYPGNNIVIDFNINDNQTYSILYEYSNEIEQPSYIYRINNDGIIESQYSPSLSNSKLLMKTTEADKSWWSKVTQYPITASITLKGLLRPAILMTYVKLNVLFYGKKYIASGYYIVTKQTDQIDSRGYRTTLELTRIGENNGN